MFAANFTTPPRPPARREHVGTRASAGVPAAASASGVDAGGVASRCLLSGWRGGALAY